MSKGTDLESRAAELATKVLEGPPDGEHELLSDMFVQLEEAAQDSLTRLEITAPPPTPLQCQAGCASCCRTTLHPLTPPEALFLLRIIELCGFRFAVSLAARSTRPGCPLLDHRNQCRFYPHRPLVCRAMNSLDVEECRKCEGQPNLDVPAWLPQYEVYTAIQNGLTKGFQKGGRAMPKLSLRKVLALDATAAWLEDEWQKGHDPFRNAWAEG